MMPASDSYPAVLPDYFVPQTKQDIINGTDTVLEFAKTLQV